MKTYLQILATIVCSQMVLSTATTAPLEVISKTSQQSRSANGGSYCLAFSANGRFLVFLSDAKNLVTNDNHTPYLNVFVRDLQTSNTILASVSMSGVGGGDLPANYPSISADGRFLAFASDASNLVPEATNGRTQVIIRDLVAGTNSVASASYTNTVLDYQSGGTYPRISADGRFVAFPSGAAGLTPMVDTNWTKDVFLRDRTANTTTLISANDAGTAAADGPSELEGITPDGSKVLFSSFSTNLLPEGVLTTWSEQLYLWDRASGQIRFATTNLGQYFPGNTSTYRCFRPSMSADGNTIVYLATPAGIWPSAHLIMSDTATGHHLVLSTNATSNGWPALSPNGERVLYESGSHIYIYDRARSTNILVSTAHSSAFPANAPAFNAVFSPDGRRVAFVSAATDIMPGVEPDSPQLFVRDVDTGVTRLVSRNLAGKPSQLDYANTAAAFNPDGTLLAFDSEDDALVENDLNNGQSDVFLFDIERGMVALVSEHAPGHISITASGFKRLNSGALSADGRRMVFRSSDSNITIGDTAAADTNKNEDVFFHDLESGRTMPLSLDDTGAFQPGVAARNPILSADGRCAVFMSGNPARGLVDYYWHELETKRRICVTNNVVGGFSGQLLERSSVAISSNGHLVAFPILAGPDYNLYVRNILTGSNMPVALLTNGQPSGKMAYRPWFSPDDRWLVFLSESSKLAPTNGIGPYPIFGSYFLYARDLLANNTCLLAQFYWRDGLRSFAFSGNSRYLLFSGQPFPYPSGYKVALVYDLQNQTQREICQSCSAPAINGDGSKIAYQTATLPAGSGTTSNDQIVLTDLEAGRTNLVSVNWLGTGPGNDHSSSPLISPDGRFVVFVSKASDLVANDKNNARDIFVRDLRQGITLLISRSLDGSGSGNWASANPVLSADGRTLAFESYASDLVQGDLNRRNDIFIYRLGAEDTDGDGLDDAWELAFFENLSHTGVEDSDGDGFTDLQELIAGTDPTNQGSCLSVLTVANLTQGSTAIHWKATPGKTYQVLYKNSVDEPRWLPLGQPITAASATASALDPDAGSAAQRFYRVLLVP